MNRILIFILFGFGLLQAVSSGRGDLPAYGETLVLLVGNRAYTLGNERIPASSHRAHCYPPCRALPSLNTDEENQLSTYLVSRGISGTLWLPGGNLSDISNPNLCRTFKEIDGQFEVQYRPCEFSYRFICVNTCCC